MNNTYLGSFIDFLDAKANIVIWSSKEEKVFDGKVYQLFDGSHEDLKQRKIKDINTCLTTMNILLTGE
jgi:hypothetical protein